MPLTSSPKLSAGYPTLYQNPNPRKTLPFHLRRIPNHRSRISASAGAPPPQPPPGALCATSRLGKSGTRGRFARIGWSSFGVNPKPVATPPSQGGPTLLCIGFGLGVAAAALGSGPTFPEEALEKLEELFEYPVFQQLVVPYFPEEIRNLTGFKSWLREPENSEPVQRMLNIVDGTKILEMMKDVDMNSPEVRKQFESYGLTPEGMFAKMASHVVVMVFENPRLEQVFIECLRNPLSIIKYLLDKEVMDAVYKICGLFPTVYG